MLSNGYLYGFYFGRVVQSILAVFGNGLTLVTIFKYEELQTSTNIFIASLALSDFIAGLLMSLNRYLFFNSIIF